MWLARSERHCEMAAKWQYRRRVIVEKIGAPVSAIGSCYRGGKHEGLFCRSAAFGVFNRLGTGAANLREQGSRERRQAACWRCKNELYTKMQEGCLQTQSCG